MSMNVIQVHILFNLEKKLGNFKVVVTNHFEKTNVEPILLIIIIPPLLLVAVST